MTVVEILLSHQPSWPAVSDGRQHCQCGWESETEWNFVKHQAVMVNQGTLCAALGAIEGEVLSVPPGSIVHFHGPWADFDEAEDEFMAEVIPSLTGMLAHEQYLIVRTENMKIDVIHAPEIREWLTCVYSGDTMPLLSGMSKGASL